MQKVEVAWTDSGTFLGDGWQNVEDVPDKVRIHRVSTTGYLVHEDEHNLYIGLSVDDEEVGVYGVQVISKDSVSHIFHLAFMSDETERYIDKD